MTLLAVISDVHGDVHALDDALAQIARLGCDLVVCAGDLVDYGLFVEETLEIFRERRIPTIRGNHDRWAVRNGKDVSSLDLSPAAVSFLDSLPTTWRQLIDGVRVVVTHARPRDDMNGILPDVEDHELARLLDQADADILLVGHTHVAFARRLPDGRMVANPGALLRDPAVALELPTPGTFGVLEVASRTFTIRRAADGRVMG